MTALVQHANYCTARTCLGLFVLCWAGTGRLYTLGWWDIYLGFGLVRLLRERMGGCTAGPGELFFSNVC